MDSVRKIRQVHGVCICCMCCRVCCVSRGTAVWTASCMWVCEFCSVIFLLSFPYREDVFELWSGVVRNRQKFEGGVSTLAECVSVCLCVWRSLSSETTAGEASIHSRQVAAHCMCHSTAGRLSKCLISYLSVWPGGGPPVCFSVFGCNAFGNLSDCLID